MTSENWRADAMAFFVLIAVLTGGVLVGAAYLWMGGLL